MLVLSRRIGERIVIEDNITLTIVGVKGNRVRIAIDAPANVRVLREELRAKHPRPIGGREAA